MIAFDTQDLAFAAFIMATLAVCVSVAHAVKDLVDRPRYKHGPEVENLDALFDRPDLSDDTVPLVHPVQGHRGRDGRRC